MTAPIASVVIPTHGRPPQLRACLEALAAHTDYAKALSAWNAAMGVVSVAGTPARPQH